MLAGVFIACLLASGALADLAQLLNEQKSAVSITEGYIDITEYLEPPYTPYKESWNFEVFRIEAAPPSFVRYRGDVLLLHDFQTSSDVWLQLNTMHALALSGYRAVAIDIPGLAKSGNQFGVKQHLLHTYEMHSFLKALSAKLNLKRPTLFSHAYSTKYALALASKFDGSELINGIVMLRPLRAYRFSTDKLANITAGKKGGVIQNKVCVIFGGYRDTPTDKEADHLLRGIAAGLLDIRRLADRPRKFFKDGKEGTMLFNQEFVSCLGGQPGQGQGRPKSRDLPSIEFSTTKTSKSTTRRTTTPTTTTKAPTTTTTENKKLLKQQCLAKCQATCD